MTLLLALVLGVTGVFTWQHDAAIKNIRADNSAVHQTLLDHEARMDRHANAIRALHEPKSTTQIAPQDTFLNL